MKKILIINLCIMMFFTGCSSEMELREKAVVQAVGIDYSEEMYKLTLQVFDFSNESQQESYQTIEGSGKDITSAFIDATINSGRLIFLGNNKVVLLSEPALIGLESILNFFSQNHQSPLQTPIAITKTSAEEIIKAKQTTTKSISGEDLYLLLKRGVQSGFYGSTSVYELLPVLQEEGVGELIPVIQLLGEKDNHSLKLTESYGVWNGGYVASVDESQSRGVNLITNSGIKTAVDLGQVENVPIIAMLKDLDYTITSDVKFSEITVLIDLNVKASIDSDITSGIISHDEARDKLESILKEDVENALKMAVDNKVDLFLFKDFTEQNYYNWVAENKLQWGEIIANGGYEVNVNAQIT